MNTITFPGLNLVFNISRIAFSINNIHIYWYAILIVLSIIIGIIIFIVKNRGSKLDNQYNKKGDINEIRF